MTTVNPPTTGSERTDLARQQTSDLALMELGFALDLTHGLADALETSMVAAHRSASIALDADLCMALPWPTTIDEYFGYLRSFAEWTPNPSALAAWQDSADDGQEARDRVRHFFLLIEQPAVDGSVVRTNEAMAKWLADFARVSSLLASPTALG